jgi:predicted nucleic acid-binding protein
MRVVVADACSLILMEKCSLLRTYGSRVELMAPRQVIEEVASPELQSLHADAANIARAISEGAIVVKVVRSRQKLPIALGPGEAATIRLFIQEGAELVLSDDGRALRTCRLLGIPFTTTPRVIVDLHQAGDLNKADARRALEKLAIFGRYSSDIVGAAIAQLTEVSP